MTDTIKTPTSDPMLRLLTAEQVAERLSVSVSLIYKLRRERRLRCVRIGRLYRFHPEDVLALMSERS